LVLTALGDMANKFYTRGFKSFSLFVIRIYKTNMANANAK
jgi:hypothetical protein